MALPQRPARQYKFLVVSNKHNWPEFYPGIARVWNRLRVLVSRRQTLQGFFDPHHQISQYGKRTASDGKLAW